MFQVDRSTNRLHRLDEKRFGDLAIREREHLQEWLAEMPSALGEELLIIQKEFDGFDETRERLDLLALDKTGQLVVIENKLDDSGRDVVWQALKYVAYCSSLTKSQIVEITQAYLDRHKGGGDARAMIAEFLDEEDIDEVVLNAGNAQRLIFVAAHFRKEVTSPVLWLISHGISAQCFKVTPYAFGEELFLDVQQIIPAPEAKEFMIGISSKESEEKAVAGSKKARHALRRDFWELCLDTLQTRGITLFQNVSPGDNHWLSAGSGTRSCPFEILLLKDGAAVNLKIGRDDAAENKEIFDRLYARREEIDAAFGDRLDWRRLDDKKSSRVMFRMYADGHNREAWPPIIDWIAEHLVRFETALREPLAEAARSAKMTDGSG